MNKKQFLVTITIDENNQNVRERIGCRFCDSVDEYIDLTARCFIPYKDLSARESLEQWGESVEVKEYNMEKCKGEK